MNREAPSFFFTVVPSPLHKMVVAVKAAQREEGMNELSNRSATTMITQATMSDQL